jgi:hypothetical protein
MAGVEGYWDGTSISLDRTFPSERGVRTLSAHFVEFRESFREMTDKVEQRSGKWLSWDKQ